MAVSERPLGDIVLDGPKNTRTHFVEIMRGSHQFLLEVTNSAQLGDYARHLVDLRDVEGAVTRAITSETRIPTVSVVGRVDAYDADDVARFSSALNNTNNGESAILLSDGEGVHKLISSVHDYHAPTGGLILVQPDLATRQTTRREFDAKSDSDLGILSQTADIARGGLKRLRQLLQQRRRPEFVRDPEVVQKLEALAEKFPVSVILIGKPTTEENKKLAQVLESIGIEPVYVEDMIYTENQLTETMPAIAAQYKNIVEMLERDASESTTN